MPARAQWAAFATLNNAAIAAQAMRDAGVARVAVLDVDYHHGNGTQAIFYDRADVFFASIHGDPAVEYLFFAGFADETGRGAGWGCTQPAAARARGRGLWRGARYRLRGDCGPWRAGAGGLAGGGYLCRRSDQPFPARTARFHADRRARVAALGLPTLFVMEGGYAVGDIGTNVANAGKLCPWLGAARRGPAGPVGFGIWSVMVSR
jgi:hypothetical protein